MLLLSNLCSNISQISLKVKLKFFNKEYEIKNFRVTSDKINLYVKVKRLINIQTRQHKKRTDLS